ncbi:hypothetical protein D9619_013338 [Psilocybe cf. subviscida]|uniref:Uncharacterized protein n=1 Tax=Psilocybe cf. subviscida TaxID=2480587 RepID=A0A8H5F973_9AGAR|nr:hypothetical protein D9619_013338 [Psilocybe cf. subviscida]
MGIVIASEPAPEDATLTSVAVSKTGTYFATADKKGNIYVYRTDGQKLVRTYFLEGCVHILLFVQIRSKTMLIAATKCGHLKAWQFNLTSNLTRWQKSYPLCVNAIALNARKDRLAVSVGHHVHLYQDPWDFSALSTPLKTWAPTTSTAGGRIFYKYPLAIGLHFTLGNDLLISYLAGHCLVRTKQPYNVVLKAAPQLPSRIAHVAVSPTGTHAVLTNLNDGFDVFDLENREFTETCDYLSTPAAATPYNKNHIIKSSFLNDQFLVTGHRDALICIFEFKGEAFTNPVQIQILDAEPGYGVKELATGVYKRKPFVIALSGEDQDSQFHLIASPSFSEQQQLTLGPSGFKKQEACNHPSLYKRASPGSLALPLSLPHLQYGVQYEFHPIGRQALRIIVIKRYGLTAAAGNPCNPVPGQFNSSLNHGADTPSLGPSLTPSGYRFIPPSEEDAVIGPSRTWSTGLDPRVDNPTAFSMRPQRPLPSPPADAPVYSVYGVDVRKQQPGPSQDRPSNNSSTSQVFQGTANERRSNNGPTYPDRPVAGSTRAGKLPQVEHEPEQPPASVHDSDEEMEDSDGQNRPGVQIPPMNFFHHSDEPTSQSHHQAESAPQHLAALRSQFHPQSQDQHHAQASGQPLPPQLGSSVMSPPPRSQAPSCMEQANPAMAPRQSQPPFHQLPSHGSFNAEPPQQQRYGAPQYHGPAYHPTGFIQPQIGDQPMQDVRPYNPQSVVTQAQFQEMQQTIISGFQSVTGMVRTIQNAAHTTGRRRAAVPGVPRKSRKKTPC